MLVAKVDAKSGGVIDDPVEIVDGHDSRGLATTMTFNHYGVNFGGARIRVLEHDGSHVATLLVAQGSDSQAELPPILAISPSGNFATDNKLGEHFGQSMVFVGLTNDGNIVTRTPDSLKTEFGFKNAPVETKDLFVEKALRSN